VSHCSRCDRAKLVDQMTTQSSRSSHPRDQGLNLPSQRARDSLGSPLSAGTLRVGGAPIAMGLYAKS
jgi:hypothetical protein